MNAEGNQGRTDGLKARNVRPIIDEFILLKYFTFYIWNSMIAVATAQVNTKIKFIFPTIRENRGVFNLNI